VSTTPATGLVRRYPAPVGSPGRCPGRSQRALGAASRRLDGSSPPDACRRLVSKEEPLQPPRGKTHWGTAPGSLRSRASRSAARFTPALGKERKISPSGCSSSASAIRSAVASCTTAGARASVDDPIGRVSLARHLLGPSSPCWVLPSRRRCIHGAIVSFKPNTSQLAERASWRCRPPRPPPRPAPEWRW
jgi:hypothetical protein